MTIVLADVGAAAFLNARLNNVWPTSKNLTIKLFVNNVDPILDTHVAGNFVIAVGGGYVDKTLVNGSWVISGTAPVQAAYALQTWTFTGSLTTNPIIYGYIVVDGDGVLQWAERLGAPFQPLVNGDICEVYPIFKLSKGTPT